MNGSRSTSILQGQTALVTGAGCRLGAAMALHLAQHGCRVAVHYCSSASGAHDTVRRIKALGGEAQSFQADFRDSNAPSRLAQEVIKTFPSLDILINSASVYSDPQKIEADHDFLRESLAEWELSLTVNARAPFFLTQALAPTLSKSANGNVINILDLSATEPFRSRAAHSVSKGALAAVTRVCSQALEGKVRINALEIGSVIPPAGLSAEELARKSWMSEERVLAELLRVVSDSSISGEIVRVA